MLPIGYGYERDFTVDDDKQSASSESEAEADSNRQIVIPNYRLFSNHHKMTQIAKSFSDRCMENQTCYFVVAQPFTAKYDRDFDWYQYRGIDYVRKRLNSKCYFLTRETKASQTHINALIWGDMDYMSKFHKKAVGKYGYHVQRVETPEDRKRISLYMVKESQTRNFDLFMDYLVSR